MGQTKGHGRETLPGDGRYLVVLILARTLGLDNIEDLASIVRAHSALFGITDQASLRKAASHEHLDSVLRS